MPHIVIVGPVSVEHIYNQFEPIYEQTADTVIKAQEAFINTKKTKLLLECVVVEDRASRAFYMIVSQGKNSVTVRLDPLTDPEKSPCVKHLLALVGQRIKARHPGSQYGTHNLEGFVLP
ncbi:hypothetical protein GF339_20065 [candidate division KSB3 bacterium]|uniref:Uncharacterized protein n=1 Tax=candidate division KSB3 bacterium TaxID=2044937 RepID=A0A9D5JZZ4_9BACT|nr:hypothetical protein [candidate division KSB3 bacterium]MBD3326891.1 hypothetical protein [candidate division KSB3 bacterium]